MPDTLNDLIERYEREALAADPITKAFCAVAKADDPEPPMFDVARDDWLTTDGEGHTHIAWRRRQELKAALADALGRSK